ncbi:copper-transporting ATPase HMA5 [Spatholobus suberectus]|nr:copper-transporting ATPase HMA5 [Spatholobus suberectus]
MATLMVFERQIKSDDLCDDGEQERDGEIEMMVAFLVPFVTTKSERENKGFYFGRKKESEEEPKEEREHHLVQPKKGQAKFIMQHDAASVLLSRSQQLYILGIPQKVENFYGWSSNSFSAVHHSKIHLKFFQDSDIEIGYNLLAIPIATGILSSSTRFQLPPWIA